MSLTASRPTFDFDPKRALMTFETAPKTVPVALLATVENMGHGLVVFISREDPQDIDDFLEEKPVYHVYSGEFGILHHEPVITWNDTMNPAVDDLNLVTRHGSIMLPHNARQSPYYHYTKMYNADDEFVVNEHIVSMALVTRK